MTRKAKFLALLLVLGLCSVHPAAAAEDLDLGGMLKLHMQRTRKMIIPLVAAMPEDKYDFKATPQIRSFREMAVHLIQDGFTHVGWSAGMSREESDRKSTRLNSSHT